MKLSASLYHKEDQLVCLNTQWGPGFGFFTEFDKDSVLKGKKQLKLNIIKSKKMWQELRDFADQQIKESK